jgi:8-oxo-dGTP pyrophosphatase MutT (NUDIX family)
MMSELQALENLKKYTPKFYQLQQQSIWHKVPLSRRSSVFVLLFLGRLGELRVILTKRSSKLRNFPGHISLPGGKADTVDETEWMVARREMEEEIGLSANNDELLSKYGFTIDHLNILPSYLSRTFSAVRPCIGFMNFRDQEGLHSKLKLTLNPGESSNVFSCPLHDFLYPITEESMESVDTTFHRVTEWMVARREMEEEIGLSANNDELLSKYGFTIDHLNILPSYLSRTFSAVRPCIGFMNFRDQEGLHSKLKLTLNPGESSNVFSCPLHDFLYPITEESMESVDTTFHRVKWGGIPWKLRSFIFKQNNPNEPDWLREIDDLSGSESEFTEDEIEEAIEDDLEESTKKRNNLELWGRLGSRRDEETNEKIYDVWGLTANILHDLAELVYTNKFNREMGEEELIYSIWKYGNQMKKKERSPEEVKLINSRGIPNEFGFNDIMPRTEFLKLKQIYKL